MLCVGHHWANRHKTIQVNAPVREVETTWPSVNANKLAEVTRRIGRENSPLRARYSHAASPRDMSDPNWLRWRSCP